MTSPIAIVEAALGLRRRRHSSVAEAENDVMEFLAAARIGVAAVEPAAAQGALAITSLAEESRPPAATDGERH